MFLDLEELDHLGLLVVDVSEVYVVVDPLVHFVDRRHRPREVLELRELFFLYHTEFLPLRELEL